MEAARVVEIRRRSGQTTRVFTPSKLGVWRCPAPASGLELSGHVSRRARTEPCVCRSAHNPGHKECTRLNRSLFLSRCKAALLPLAAAAVESSFSVPLTTFSLFSPSPSFLEPQPCSHSLSFLLQRSRLLRSAELNLNDTLVGGWEKIFVRFNLIGFTFLKELQIWPGSLLECPRQGRERELSCWILKKQPIPPMCFQMGHLHI